jgi:hypothetical protein
MINAKDYADDFSMSKAFEDYIDSAYWSDSFDTEEAFQMMMDSAQENGILLDNVDEFDYDRFFYEIYKDSEKGLS